MAAAGAPGGWGVSKACRDCAGWRERLAEAQRSLSGALADAKVWRYWHGKAQERAAWWQAQYEGKCAEPTARKLAEAEREVGKQRRRIADLERRVELLEQEKAGVEQRNRDLLRKPFGTRSETRGRCNGRGAESGPGGGSGGEGEARRKRGGQPGSVAHGRLERSGLAVREEVWEPEAASCRCPECGREYARNGEEVSERIEIEVSGYVRRIRRPRRKAVCACAARRGAPAPQVIAPLEPTLFRGSPYGVSVWTVFLLQVYWQRHPARAFEREWSEFGVRLAVGTLLGHARALRTWFEPLERAIAERQAQAPLVHGDETSWVIHVRGEEGKNPRCWLWACLSADAVRLRIEPSRSALAAASVFGGIGRRGRAVLVCDRYPAYTKLARTQRGQFQLAWCWAHMRRDFWAVARARPDLQGWTDGVLEEIGSLYRLNQERLAAWDGQRPLADQSAAFQAAHKRLEEALSALFERARQELQALSATGGEEGQAQRRKPDPRQGPLQSLLKHRAGLEVFVGKPLVPLDNNPVERALRRPVVGRKLSYGSHSEGGAALQGLLLSVFGTLSMAGVDLQRWLRAYLRECAAIGPRAAPLDPRSWLPWGLPAERARALRAASDRGPAP